MNYRDIDKFIKECDKLLKPKTKMVRPKVKTGGGAKLLDLKQELKNSLKKEGK